MADDFDSAAAQVASGNTSATAPVTPPSAPAPANGSNPFDEAAGAVVASNTALLRSNLLSAQGVNPQEEGRLQRLAAQSGVPLESVRANPDVVASQVSNQQLDADALLKQFPHTAQFLQLPENARLVAQSVPATAAVEQAVNAMPPASPAAQEPTFGEKLKSVLTGEGETARTLGEKITHFMGSGGGDLQVLAAAPVQAGIDATRLIHGLNTILGVAPVAWDKLAAVFGGDGTAATAWWQKNMLAPLEKTVEQGESTQQGASLGQKIGAQVGSLAMMLPEAEAMLAPGVISPLIKSDTALAGAVNQVAHGAAGMTIPALSQGLDTFQKVYDQTGDLNHALAAFNAETSLTMGQGALPLGMEGGVAKRVLTSIPVSLSSGEVQRNAMNAVLPQEMQQPFDWENALLNAGTMAVMAGIAGPRPFDSPHPAIRQTYIDAANAEKSMADVQALHSLAAVAENAPLREHNPDKFHQFVETMAGEKGVSDVYVAPSVLDAALRSNIGESNSLLQKMPDLPDRIAEAQNLGGDVRIPLADFATHVAGTKIGNDILPEMKASPEGMTYTEGQAYYQNQVAENQRVLDSLVKARAADNTWRESAQKVQDAVHEELNAVGRFPSDVNKANAVLHRAIYETLAARENITPEEAYAKYKAQISGDDNGGGGLEAMRQTDAEFEEQQKLLRMAAAHFGTTHDAREAGYITPGGTMLDLSGRHEATGYEKFGRGFKVNYRPEAGQPDYLSGRRSTDHRDLSEEIYDALGENDGTAAMLAFQRKAHVIRFDVNAGISANFMPTRDHLTSVMRAWNQEHRGEAMGVDVGDPRTGNTIHSEEVERPSVDKLYKIFRDALGVNKHFEQSAKPFSGTETAKTLLPEGTTHLNVDGVDRPALNSNGKPIHPTEEGVRNFWRWFGDSKVVDAEGRPLVVYHGTGESIDSFEGNRGAFYFTPDAKFAEGFADNAATNLRDSGAYDESVYGKMESGGDNIVPVYLRAENVFDPRSKKDVNALVDEAVPSNNKVTREIWAKRFSAGMYDDLEGYYEDMRILGFDGFYEKESGTDKFWNIGVFDPTQIKSATGNSGEFNPRDANILHQAAYHGSPYKFDKFSLDHMGKGEGAQAYGWGLYFAGNKEVAEWYRKSLGNVRHDLKELADSRGLELSAKARAEIVHQISGDENASAETIARRVQNANASTRSLDSKALAGLIEEYKGAMKGQLYRVEIPEDDTMLLWDKPLLEQPEKVRVAVQRAALSAKGALVKELRAYQGNALNEMSGDETIWDGLSGNDLYKALGKKLGSQEAASKYLHSLGISGIKYLDGTSRSKGEGHHNYVIFDDNAIKILDTFYQAAHQRTPTGPRGSYLPGERVIGLLKNADLSTFIHETGHFLLDTYARIAVDPAAPERVKRDVDTLLQAAKVPGATPEERIANWHGMTLEDQRTHHETIAEMFERYLFEGKAPTVELQSVFSRMRAWMLSVYRSLQGLLAQRPLSEQLSPEVRQVFDRMLATDEAIAQAEHARGYVPLFDSAEAAGVTDHAYQRYLNTNQEATDQAIADMQRRTLGDMKWLSNAKGRALKALQAEANEKRQAIREEVTKEVEQQPVYRAERWLRKGELLDENGEVTTAVNDEARSGAKLNTEGVRELFETEPEASRPRLSDLAGMTSPKGLHPDLVADMFGFNSGEGLVRALLDREPMQSVIDGMTDQRMLERHGELSDSQSVEQAANDAVANDARAKFMATGLKILTKSPVSASALAKAAKESAAATVREKAIKELRPLQYEAQETKANREALKNAAKDPAAAIKAQRAAMLNNALAREARKAVREVEKGIVYLKRFDKDSIAKKLDVDVREQLTDLLDRFDLRQNPTTAPTRAEQSLQEWVQSQIDAGYSPIVPASMLNPTFRKHYKDLTVEEFRGLIDTAKALEHIGRERKSITLNNQKVDLAQYVAEKLVPKMQEKPNKFEPGQIIEKPEERYTNPIALALDHLNSWRRGMASSLKMQEYKRNQYDAHELLGPFGESIFEPVFAADYRKGDMIAALSKDYQTKAEELGREWQDSLLKSVDNKVLRDPDLLDKDGNPTFLQLTRAKMLGMALHVGNESNFDKLTRGWNFRPEDVWRFLHDNMTAKDWEAVQTVWDLYEKHWPEIEAMNRRLGNTSPDKIEARAFKTQFGEQRGGYAAIEYDPLRSKRGEKAAAGRAINPGEGLFDRGYFRNDTTTNGSLNARQSNYTDRVSLDYHYHARKLNESIHDLAFREALIDVNKILEHPDFRRQFRLSYGPEAYRSMQEWLGNLANSDVTERGLRDFQKVLTYARTGIVINGIGFRISTVLKHGGSAGIKTLGYFPGTSKAYFAYRMAQMGTQPKAQIQGAIEKFPEIRARLRQQDRDYRQLTASLFEPESKMAKAHRYGHAMVAWSDMMTAVPTAWAAYDRAITEGIPVKSGGTGKPMTEEQAVKYACKIVREAHGTNIQAARSNVVNSNSEAVKMFTTLYGFMNNTYGQAVNMVDQLKTPGYSSPEALARGFTAVIVPALWAGYLVEGNPEDDKNGLGHWFAKAIGGEVAGMVPLVRDAWNTVEGFKGAGLVGVESWLSTMTKPFMDAYRMWEGKENKTAIRDTADALGVGLHIPGLGQGGAAVQYAVNAHKGIEHPQNAGEYAEGLVKGHGDKQH